jgi:hypothetical protein
MNVLSLIEGSDPIEDHETEAAYFKTRMTWLTPVAYLHIIYKPMPVDFVRNQLRSLDAPAAVFELLESSNGARLFAESLTLFGLWKPGQLFGGPSVFELPTINLAMMNYEADQELGFAIGTYGDGTSVVIDRGAENVTGWRSGKPVCRWASVEQWLTSECSRLGACFDRRGRLLPGNSLPISPPSERAFLA